MFDISDKGAYLGGTAVSLSSSFVTFFEANNLKQLTQKRYDNLVNTLTFTQCNPPPPKFGKSWLRP